ncbi:hypothetical protein BGZ58_004098 [Dissophora ornata]|nr:hypothetical protein BGZ58_004098 [Dissophora ornata]
MTGSDSGSSDLSEGSSLSSDNSSGSEADVLNSRPQSIGSRQPKSQQRQRKKQGRPHNPIHPQPTAPTIARLMQGDTHTNFLSSGSDCGSDSGDFSDEDQAAAATTNAPISLSASQSVYSKEIMERSMMLTLPNAKFNSHSSSTTTSRGRGRGRGRAPLAGHGSGKYDASGATVIDFEDIPLEDDTKTQEAAKSNSAASTPTPRTATTTNTVHKKKEGSTKTKTKTPKVTTGTSNKQKQGARKVGRPKSVSKDVYCICREPYDGVEFMIACDRCEEWFHGRCIGMKPQEAKKSSHYYCDTCQRIRRMFGVSTPDDVNAKFAKSKVLDKKSAEKQAQQTEASGPKEKQPTLKIRVKPISSSASTSGSNVIDNTADYFATKDTLEAASYPHSVQESSSAAPNYSQPTKVRAISVHGSESSHSVVYNTPSISALQTSINPPHYSIGSASAEDDDDEDVCPVCDFQCTCNNNDDTVVAAASSTKSEPIMDDDHTYTAIKVPFQPNPELHASSAHVDQRPSFLDAEKRPVIKRDAVNTAHDETFRTSHKNPMSTPNTQRRPSVMRRGGKGLGKAPYSMNAAESQQQHAKNGRGKSLKGKKASMHLYQHTGIDSGSDFSDEFSDDGDVDGSGKRPHSSNGKAPARSRERYEDDGEDSADVDDSMSLSSADSLSDFEEEVAPSVSKASGASGLMKEKAQHSAGKGQSQHSTGKGQSQSRVLVSTMQASHSIPIQNPTQEDTKHRVVVVKKRGPGRPRKQKDPLIVSREDEMALYTPAVAARKQAGTYTQKAEVVKAARAPVISRARTELPFIAYDPEVAEDVAALNAHDSNSSSSDDEEHAVGPTATASEDAHSETFSEDDIFGDGDLSDELSGDLSDIMSDDFDDFSDDDLSFDSSDEEDEASSSGSPKEFHYSDMEEQDESLVDSDSSINSLASNDSDSSDSATDSENEIHVQDMSDEYDEEHEFEHDGAEELIDEEELLRLEEEERLFLAKAHSLHDVFSEEDSDPDRNPFESSEDEEDEDERVFDGDDDDVYSDDYLEEDYYDEEFDEMNEQEILARLQGVQSDIQALMMIPPEQQEQLLLLQHYEEIHRQQQEQQMHQQPPQDMATSTLSNGTEQLDDGSQDGTQMVGLLTDSGLLPSFDLNVPDMDAVSEQLAASLASSIAKSMAAKAVSEANNTDFVDALDSNNPAGVPTNSPKSASTVSPESSAFIWTAPIPSTPSPSNSNLASIPTPANTPTPPNTTSGASPPLSIPSSTDAQNQLEVLEHSLASTTSKTQALQGKVPSLPNSSSYRSLTSIIAVPTIGGRPVQPILPRLAPGESVSDLSPFAKAVTGESQLNQSRLQSGSPSAFKEAAQKALGAISSKAGVPETTHEDGQASGDTTDDASPEVHSADFRKRKGGDLKTKDVVVNQGKRRRLSTASAKDNAKSFAASIARVVLGPTTAPTPESESIFLSSSMSSPPTSSMSTAPSIKPLSLLDVAPVGMDSSSSMSSAGSSSQIQSVYDFIKPTMPFTDPTARIFTSSMGQYQGTSSQHIIRARKHSLKGKELKQADVMPMDDLLDTSALYGRSSSRSPSPDRTAAGEEGGDTETGLKDLNRWERVPIGTFRRSRRPSSPHVGLQGALKSGNVTMPATLLADHQQHQQQLYQESHRLHKKVTSIRKRRPSSSTSDILSAFQRRDSGRPSSRLHSQISTAVDSKGMQIDIGLDSSMGLHLHTPGIKDGFHRSQSSLGLSEGPLMTGIPSPGMSQPMIRDPMRRRRRVGSGRALPSSQRFSDLHPGLGIGLEDLASSSLGSSSKGGRMTSSQADRMTGLADLRDLMTDSSQLPSSACPTPLHSPLFSATAASGRVHHHSSGEPVVGGDQGDKAVGHDDGSRNDDTIVSHLELDIGKEMDGFHERLLLAKAKADKGEN